MRLHGDTEDERKSATAGLISSWHISVAHIVIGHHAGTNIYLIAACDVLAGHQKELRSGDLSSAESMLMNQAVALRATDQTGLDPASRRLPAQSVCSSSAVTFCSPTPRWLALVRGRSWRWP